MKSLKILVSLIGLVLVFCYTNVSAMENVANKKICKKKERNRYFLCKDINAIFFDFAGRLKKKKGDIGYYDSTEIAEKVLRDNIGIYKRMLNKINLRPKSKIYGFEHFDLDYVHVLLEKYLDALRKKLYVGLMPYYELQLYMKYLRAFNHYNSKLILEYDDGNVDTETGLFSYSVVFKISDHISDEFFNSANTDAAKKVFNNILDFFVVFLDFFKEAYNYKLETEELPEWERPELKEEEEHALLYPTDLMECIIQDKKVSRNIYENIFKKFEDEAIAAEENGYVGYDGVKFNGSLEDLFKFYEKVYNEIAYNEKLKCECSIFDKAANDKYFQLFNPKNIKSIHILNYVHEIILLKFKEDRFSKSQYEFLKEQSDLIKNNNEFLEQNELLKNQYRILKNKYEKQTELLKDFISFDKNKINFLNSMLGVSTVKQIISAYITGVKRKKNRIEYRVEDLKKKNKKKEELDRIKMKNMRMNSEIQFRKNMEKKKNICKFNICNTIGYYTYYHVPTREYITKHATKDVRLENIKFNCESEDLCKYYKILFNNILKNGGIPCGLFDEMIVSSNLKHFELFNPESIEYIGFLNGGFKDVVVSYKEGVNFKKETLDILKSLKPGDDVGNSLDFENTMLLIVFNEIVISYVRSAKRKHEFENKKYMFDFDRGYNKFRKTYEMFGKEIKDEIMSDKNLKFNNVKFNKEAEDLLKFYKEIYFIIEKNGGIKSFKVEDELFKLLYPLNIKHINLIKDYGLRKVILKYDEGILKDDEGDKAFREFENVIKHANSNDENKINYFDLLKPVILLREIISIYFECVKQREEIKDEIYYKTKHKYKIGLGGDYDYLKTRYDEIIKVIESEIVKITEKKYVKFNGKYEDFYEFYKIIYKILLEKGNIGYYNIRDSLSFKLLNPKKLKYIRVENNKGLDEILFEYYENVNFNKSQLQYLESLRSNVNVDMEFFDNDLGLSILKQIILIYFENVKKNKEELNK